MPFVMRRQRRGVAVVLGLALLASLPLDSAAQSPGLKIIVIDGEDAVNIIQQKTAVAPVVEVRDRNDLPVAGAVVKFSIQGGRATFGGARTLTVTTNVAGRAAVSGFTPTASGAVQISASAAFQGQTAAVTIAQTNVMTAAQAAQAATVASGAGGSGGGAGAGGAAVGGGGGGMSATTIGLVGAAIGGGALAATQLGGDGESGGETQPSAPKSVTYSGTYAGQLTQVLGTGLPPAGCSSTSAVTGTVVMQLATSAGGVASGTAQVNHHNSEVANICLGYLQTPYSFRTPSQPVTGTADNLVFTYTQSGTYVNPNGSGATGTFVQAFAYAGALDGNAITGVLTITYTNQPSGGPGSGPGGGGSVSIPITMR